MTDNMTPQLTLDPTAAAAEAVPTLTLTPEAPEAPQVEEEKKIEPVEMDDKLLTDAEKKAVEDFSHKIDIRDTNMILQYGAAAQKSVAGFSENALNSVRNKDLGEIGKDLSQLVVELKGFGEEEEKKGLAGLFRRTGSRLETMKAQYGKVEANVDKIAQSLEQHQITLLKDVAMFDQMYELNLKYYKELTMYILAGKKRLEEVRTGELEELRLKAEKSGLAEDAQAYNDLVNLCNRFEKKIHDLKLSKTVAIQTAPQIRLIQNNDKMLVDKIQTAILSTIPLWKSQIVIALGLHRQESVLKMQRSVSDATNTLLTKNAELLRQNSTEVARESERGIVDLETLKKVNADLISSIEETIKVQQEGRAARQSAEAELCAQYPNSR